MNEAGVSGRIHAEDAQNPEIQSSATKAANKARREDELERSAKRQVSPAEEAKSLLARAMAFLRKPVETPLVTRVSPWLLQQPAFKVLQKHLLASRQRLMAIRLFLRTKADATFASIQKQFKAAADKSLSGLTAMRKSLALRYPKNRFGAFGIIVNLTLDGTKPLWSPVMRVLAPIGRFGTTAFIAISAPIMGSFVLGGTLLTAAAVTVFGGMVVTGKFALKIASGPANTIGHGLLFAGRTIHFTVQIIRKGVVSALHGGLAVGSGVIAATVLTGRSIGHGAVSGVRMARNLLPRIRYLSNAVFVQAYLLELEKAFEEAFRTDNSAPVYALLLEELPVADPASLALIRGDSNVETNVRGQIFDFAEVCLSPFSIALAQQSIKWLLKQKTSGDSWFVRTGEGDDSLLSEYVTGGWKIPAEGFRALPPSRIENFVTRIERLNLNGEQDLLNQLRIWHGAVTTYYLNKGLVRSVPRWESGDLWNNTNSGSAYQNQTNWHPPAEGADNWSWSSFRNFSELTQIRRQRLQNFMCRTARRFPQERSAASIIELQDIFVQVARLYSGSLGKALLWEAAIEQDSCFLSGIINRYPLDKKEIQGIAQEFLLMRWLFLGTGP